MVISLRRGIDFVEADERFDFNHIKKISVKFKSAVSTYQMNDDVKMHNKSLAIF